MCLACYMGQHHDCPVYYIDDGKTAECKCQNPECMEKRETTADFPKSALGEGKSEAPKITLVASQF